MANDYTNGSAGKLHGLSAVALVQSHEDRLQAVQSEIGDMRAEVGECKADIKALGNQFTEGNARAIEMVNAGFRQVTDRLEPLQKAIGEMDKRVNTNTGKIEHLDTQEKTRLSRRQKIRTTVLGLGLAGGSAIAGKFGGAIGTWLTSLVGG